MGRIFVVGSLNIDLVMQSGRLPLQGETMVGDAFTIHLGGKGQNQAVCAAKLGGEVRFCGCVGDDVFADRIHSNCAGHNINTDHVRTIEGQSSGIALIHVIDGDNRIMLIPGANNNVTHDQVTSFISEATQGDILVVQLEIPADVVAHAIRLAHAQGLTVIFNPAPMKDLGPVLLDAVDVLVVNRIELSMMSSKDDVVEACDEILSKGVKHIVVTLGKDGYLYKTSGSLIEKGGYVVDVVDTTGAGDAFVGAFAYGLSCKHAIDKSLSVANMTAAISVGKLGAQTAYPTRDELDMFIGKKHRT